MEQPYENKYIRQLGDLENYDEISDEEAPEDAVAVQIIYEQVKSANSHLLRQIKIYYDETSAIERITKIYKDWFSCMHENLFKNIVWSFIIINAAADTNRLDKCESNLHDYFMFI